MGNEEEMIERIAFLMVILTMGTTVLPAQDMMQAAKDLVASLAATEHSEMVFEVDDANREIWHFLPVSDFARYGKRISELSAGQQEFVFGLIEASLSATGYGKVKDIISLELVLKAMENNSPRRDPGQYHIAVYGAPADEGVWAWGFTGHHLSLHFTVVDGAISGSPTFLGANPAEVRAGDRMGLRVLGHEEDLGLALISGMSDDQRQKAVFLEVAPYDIFTANESKVSALNQDGISYRELSAEQQRQLHQLVDLYLNVVKAPVADSRRKLIESDGWDQVYFAWAGVTDRSGGHYYRVQGPSFLIEFDNTQNDANHIHCVWREFDGDFGRDLIREHYLSQH